MSCRRGADAWTRASRCLDRAEYSLHERSIILALLVGGTTLLVVGILRLLDAGFRSMPRSVALLASVSGLIVAAFGIAYPFIPRDTATDAKSPSIALQPASSPEATADGGIRGTVRTSAGKPVADADVTLVPLFEAKGIEERATTSDDDGRFVFDDVDVNPGAPYAVDVRYDGADFSSGVLRSPRGRDDPLAIVVAHTTKDDDRIRVTTESLVLVGDASGAQAVHALKVANDGRRAFVGRLRLPLLPGAIAVQEGMGLDRRFLDLADGEMLSMAPVLPGTHDVTYSYVVQMTRRGVSLDRTVAMPTGTYELLVGGDLAVASYRGLRDDGKVAIGPRGGEKDYHRYIARDLDVNDGVEALVAEVQRRGSFRIIGPVAAALVAIAIIAIPLVRRRLRTRLPPDGSEPVSAESVSVDPHRA